MEYAPLKSFYSNLVTNEYCTGDIWSNLPTFGLLKKRQLPGVIITPACDLANDKAETITYLPIIPIHNYFATTSFLSTIKGTFLSLCDQIKFVKGRKFVEKDWPPCSADIQILFDEIAQIKSQNKTKILIDRLTKLLEHLQITVSSEWLEANIADMSFAVGESTIDKIFENIVVNNLKNDIHFLPSDQQPPSWTIIEKHSVILFRYPMTIPREFLELAQSRIPKGWANEVKALSKQFSISQSFFENQPIKMLQISQPFLHDMINRFVSLYARLGSPDFTSHTIRNLVKELKE